MRIVTIAMDRESPATSPELYKLCMMVAVLVPLTIAIWLLSVPREDQLPINIVIILPIGPFTSPYSCLLRILLCVSKDSTRD